MTADDVRKAIRRACKEAGSQMAWAGKIGVSPAFVTDVLMGRREPSPAVLKPLGLERIVQYRKVREAPAQ